jgi:uncharacterized protein YjeT (DUF2065 family)
MQNDDKLSSEGGDMEAGVERLAAIVLILTCLSHIAAPGAWVRLFSAIRAQGEAAGLINAAIHLPLGLLIAALHPVWGWPSVIVTLAGWALVIKGTAHLVAPSLSQRTLKLVDAKDGVRCIRIGGIFMLPLGLAIGWISLGGLR